MNGQTVLAAAYCIRCHATVTGEALCTRCRSFFRGLTTVSPAGGGGHSSVSAKHRKFAGPSRMYGCAPRPAADEV
jgi:hypothetical protein